MNFVIKFCILLFCYAFLSVNSSENATGCCDCAVVVKSHCNCFSDDFREIATTNSKSEYCKADIIYGMSASHAFEFFIHRIFCVPIVFYFRRNINCSLTALVNAQSAGISVNPIFIAARGLSTANAAAMEAEKNISP